MKRSALIIALILSLVLAVSAQAQSFSTAAPEIEAPAAAEAAEEQSPLKISAAEALIAKGKNLKLTAE